MTRNNKWLFISINKLTTEQSVCSAVSKIKDFLTNIIVQIYYLLLTHKPRNKRLILNCWFFLGIRLNIIEILRTINTNRCCIS